jgi:hypothetical protein
MRSSSSPSPPAQQRSGGASTTSPGRRTVTSSPSPRSRGAPSTVVLTLRRSAGHACDRLSRAAPAPPAAPRQRLRPALTRPDPRWPFGLATSRQRWVRTTRSATLGQPGTGLKSARGDESSPPVPLQLTAAAVRSVRERRTVRATSDSVLGQPGADPRIAAATNVRQEGRRSLFRSLRSESSYFMGESRGFHRSRKSVYP